VAKNNFLTDKFTTTGSLAAVAYGSSELFYTVADQIRTGSLSSPLDEQLPSNLVLDYVSTKTILKETVYIVLDLEYKKDNNFTDFIDIFYRDTVERFSDLVCDSLLYIINRISDYNSSLEQILEDSLMEVYRRSNPDPDLVVDFVGIAKNLIQRFREEDYLVEDLNKIILIAANNPITKISAAPPDRLVSLEQVGRLSKKYNGVEIGVGTTSVADYYRGRSTYNSSDVSLKNSVSQGYVGYPLAALLGESLLDNDSIEYYTVSFEETSEVVSDPLYNINLSTINI